MKEKVRKYIYSQKHSRDKIRDPLKEACIYSQEHSEECNGVSIKELQTSIKFYNYFNHNEKEVYVS